LNQDPREYFDSQQANVVKTLGNTLAGTKQIKRSMNTHEAYGSLRELISEIKAVGLSDPVVKPEVALKVIDYFDHVFYCKGKLQTQYFLCRQMLTAQYYVLPLKFQQIKS